MTSSTARQARAGRELFENVTDPFDGTLNDDLVVERTDKGLKVLKNGSARSVVEFERKLPQSSPQVAGKDGRTLSPEDLLLALCVHGSVHMWSSLRWVADVARLLERSPQLDWNYTWQAHDDDVRRALGLGLLVTSCTSSTMPMIGTRKASRMTTTSCWGVLMNEECGSCSITGEGPVRL